MAYAWGALMNDEEVDRIIGAMFGKFTSALPIVLAYWWSSWGLGAPWWKAPVVGTIAGFLYAMRWGTRWISRVGFVLVVLSTSVWIEALPRPQEWSGIASNLAVKLK